MRSERYLTRPQEYEKVHGQGCSWASGPVVMRAVRNGLGSSRYGFSIGRRVGNAVKRNRVKRRLREVMRRQVLAPGWDVVIIARASAAASSYAALQGSVTGVLSRAGLLTKIGIERAPRLEGRV